MGDDALVEPNGLSILLRNLRCDIHPIFACSFRAVDDLTRFQQSYAISQFRNRAFSVVDPLQYGGVWHEWPQGLFRVFITQNGFLKLAEFLPASLLHALPCVDMRNKPGQHVISDEKRLGRKCK